MNNNSFSILNYLCCLSKFFQPETFKQSSLAIQKKISLENQNKIQNNNKEISQTVTISLTNIETDSNSKFPFLTQISESNTPKGSLKIDDFKIKDFIGKGSFGKVYLVINLTNNQEYAMKVLNKSDIINYNQMEKIILERNIMKDNSHPFIIKLKFAFQTNDKIFLVMNYYQAGDLFKYLKKQKRFNEETVKFYAIEIILALDYLHNNLKIVYRDLKPENILLDNLGHIKLSDFGLSKCCKNSYTLCGTPQYVAPEIILQCGHNTPVDIWSLGCLLYEMLTGKAAFTHKNKDSLFRSILEGEPYYPSYLSEVSKNLIQKCLIKKPSLRITLDKLKKHEFFKDVNWTNFLTKKFDPPIKPDLEIDSTKGSSTDIKDLYYVDIPYSNNEGKIYQDFANFTFHHDFSLQDTADEEKLPNIKN